MTTMMLTTRSSNPLLPFRRGGGRRLCEYRRCVHPRLKGSSRRLQPLSATALFAGGLSAAASAAGPAAALPRLLFLRSFGLFLADVDDVFPLDWSPWSKSTSIIQSAPHGATLWLVTTCALSIALGALLINLFSVMDVMKQASLAGAKKEDRMILWGVDVTRSRFFGHSKVLEAVQFAALAHGGQFRKTGEPYVSHCIETAIIVEHNLPPGVHYERYVPIMIAALLHDVIDDTTVDLDAIQARFGKVVAHMVGKVSKLSQMNQLLRRGKRKGWAEYSPQHFQSLRKMIVDMVFEEPLVILIKLADRLHNMRTVFVLKREKQCSVAEETLEVWCTMAECLGWDALKSEMEDLCFAALEPDKYCALRAHLDRMWNLPTLRVVEQQANNSSLPANALDPAPPLTIRARRAADAAAARRSLSGASAAGSSPRSRRPSPPPSSREISKATAAAATVIKDSPGPRAGMPPLTDMVTGSLTNAAVKEVGLPRSPSKSLTRSRNLGICIVPPSEGGADDLDWQGAAAAAAQAAGQQQQPQGVLPPLVTSASGAAVPVGTAPIGAVRQRGGRESSATAAGTAYVAGEWGGQSGSVRSRGAAAVADAPAAPGGVRSGDLERVFVQGLPGEDDPQGLCADSAPRSSSAARDSAASPVSGYRQGGYVLYTEAMLRGDAPPPARCSACAQQRQQQQQEGAEGLGREDTSYTGFEHTMNHLLHSHRQSSLQSTLAQQNTQQQHERQHHNHHQHQQKSAQARHSKSLLPTLSLPSSLSPHLPFFSRKAPPLSTSADTTSASTTPSLSDTSTNTPGSVRLGALQQQQQQQQRRSTSLKPLSMQQECLRALVSTVVPFDSVNFKNTKSLSNSTRRGLEVLDQCAEVLFSEVMLRSSGGGLGLSIEGRLKSLHSVYRKMVRKGCSIAEVFDARALRVIVDDEGGSRSRDAVETCYKLVSTVHSIWKPVPHEFDDYVANPKPSGYQALHTAVKGPGGIPMEVQIKTSSMHELAEYGAAAHFVYKENTSTASTKSASTSAARPSPPSALPLPLPLSMEGAPSAAPSPSSDVRGPIDPRSGSTALFGQVACKVSQALCLPHISPQQHSESQPEHTAASTSDASTPQQHSEQPADTSTHLSTLPQQPQQAHPPLQARWVGVQTSCDSYDSEETQNTEMSAVSSSTSSGSGGSSSGSSGSSSDSGGNSSSWGIELYGPGSIAASAAAQQQQQQQQQQGVVQAEAGVSVSDAAGEASVLASLQPESTCELDEDQGSAAGAPPPIFRGRGWVGQPVLRIAKDKLRYGVVVGNSGGGKRLLVAVKLGPTHPLYPTRVPDYSFYSALQEHVREKAWNTPGRGDLVLRLEEFVLSNNGRFHRKDHMGYVLPAETLTLLEGYEEEAEALARSAQQLKLQQLLLSRPGQQQLQLQQQLQQQAQQQLGQQQQQQQQRDEQAQAQQQGYRGSAASLSERVREENANRFRRQMQEAHLRTMQLRKAIEWGRVAIGRYTPAGRAPSSEVAVLIWPGGAIEHWPRGTTVAEVVRFKGIPSPHEPRDVRASATSIAGGEDPGWLVRNGTFAGARYNVNNRLVPESTVLNDGDLVILTGEKVKI